MAEAAVQQDHRRAVAVRRMPDARAVVFQPALEADRRQRRGTVPGEPDEIVILDVLDLRAHRYSLGLAKLKDAIVVRIRGAPVSTGYAARRRAPIIQHAAS